jgi:hypothetical protein
MKWFNIGKILLVLESSSVGPDDNGTISGGKAPPIRDDPDSPP